MRVAIDLDVRVGAWYDVIPQQGSDVVVVVRVRVVIAQLLHGEDRREHAAQRERRVRPLRHADVVRRRLAPLES